MTPSKDKSGHYVYNASGLIYFRLALWSDGKEIEHTTAVTGQPGLQHLVKCADRQPGCDYPLGEGIYSLGDSDAMQTDRVNWASGKRYNYRGDWGEGLGPVWVGIHPDIKGRYRSRTLDYGIHEDSNQAYAPGSRGCCTLQDPNPATPDNERMIQVFGAEGKPGWFQRFDIRELHVDHGLGTMPKPQSYRL